MAMTSEGNKPKLISKASIPYLCKLIELCLTIVIVGLIVDPTNNGILAFDQNHSGIVYVSWPGYIIINTVLLITHLMGDRMPKRTLVLFAVLGACLYIAAASVVIHDWRKNRTTRIALHPSKHYQDMAISAGILSLFTAMVMFLEAGFIIYYDSEDEYQ